MAETVTREALRETATALRLNRPVVAVLLALMAAGVTWWITGQIAWGGAAAFGAAAIMFVPLFAWNVIAVIGKRLMALEQAPNKESAVEVAREVRERRRKMIDDARKMVAQHEINRDNWERTMQISPAFAAIRPHLSPSFFRQGGPTVIFVHTKQIHEHNVERFVRELDRLEKEWGLS